MTNDSATEWSPHGRLMNQCNYTTGRLEWWAMGGGTRREGEMGGEKGVNGGGGWGGGGSGKWKGKRGDCMVGRELRDMV